MKASRKSNQAAETQTLAGLTECHVSPGGMLTLPAEYLPAFDGHVVAVPAVFGAALWLYPFPAWKSVLVAFHAVDGQLPEEIRHGLVMRTIGHGVPISIEKRKPSQGRFTLPEQVRLFAGRALLEGCGHFLALHPFTEAKEGDRRASSWAKVATTRKLVHEPLPASR